MKTPWKTIDAMEPGRSYVAVATELIPKSMGSTGALFRGARLSSKQMERSAGVVGFATLARPLRKQYGTLSVWESEDALAAFVRSADHGELVRTMGDELDAVRSVRWTVTAADGRPTWRDGFERLAAARV